MMCNRPSGRPTAIELCGCIPAWKRSAISRLMWNRRSPGCNKQPAKSASGLEQSDTNKGQRAFRAEAAHAPKPGPPSRAGFCADWGEKREQQEHEDVKRQKTRQRFGAKRQKL